MFHLCPVFLEVKAFENRTFLVVTCPAVFLSRAIGDKNRIHPIFNGLLAILHDGQSFVITACAVTCFALNSHSFVKLGVKQCGISAESRGVALHTFRCFGRGYREPLFLCNLQRLFSLQALYCLRMLTGFPDFKLITFCCTLMTHLARGYSHVLVIGSINPRRKQNYG